ncbi:MAG: hypothetical protein Q4D38_05530 [Planctomycetia bacterium]|nr:hypothetical protein [Planctomycetia bacterium]
MVEEDREKPAETPLPLVVAWTRSVLYGACETLRVLEEIFFPHLCIYCGTRVDDEEVSRRAVPEVAICSDCQQRLIPPQWIGCLRCGRFEADEFPGRRCSRCTREEFEFDAVLPFGKYQDELRLAIFRMKTPRGEILARALAVMFYEYRKRLLQGVRADVIVPVPMHRFYRWRRGINNPDIIADVLGEKLGLPVEKHLLHCVRMTYSQREVSMEERRQNVRGVFAADPRAQLWTGKHALLVDDVVTTGATASEAAMVLKRDLGFRRVSVASIARAKGEIIPQKKATSHSPRAKK